MWFERFVIIVVSLAGEPFERFANATYNPTWADWGIMAGSFGWFFMWFLLFVKNFPAVAISEVQEVLPAPKRGKAVAARNWSMRSPPSSTHRPRPACWRGSGPP